MAPRACAMPSTTWRRFRTSCSTIGHRATSRQLPRPSERPGPGTYRRTARCRRTPTCRRSATCPPLGRVRAPPLPRVLRPRGTGAPPSRARRAAPPPDRAPARPARASGSPAARASAPEPARCSGSSNRSPSPSRDPSGTRSRRSGRTSTPTPRCGGSSSATWARGRRSSRWRGPRGRPGPAFRRRCSLRPRSWPSSMRARRNGFSPPTGIRHALLTASTPPAERGGFAPISPRARFRS